MTKDHTIHSINILLLRSHVHESNAATVELERQFSGFEHHLDSGEYRPAFRGNVLSRTASVLAGPGNFIFGSKGVSDIGSISKGTIGRWTTFDGLFTDIADLLEDNPHSQHLDLVIYRPYGENTPIIGLANSEGLMEYRHLSKAFQEIAHELDPDFYISSILNAPEDKYQLAYSEWLDDALERNPVYTSSIFISAEAQIRWFEIGGELSYQEDRYPDGSVTLTF
ncbi:MAG: hypothetical protein F4010_00775, partial [Cenarchaeum sp. SB0669_bin_11]|nr:hypothetical protein [Cenarchaeum sp. SB0669_bin_11]